MKTPKKSTHGGARRVPHPVFGFAKSRNISLYDAEVKEIKQITGEKSLTSAVRQLLVLAKK